MRDPFTATWWAVLALLPTISGCREPAPASPSDAVAVEGEPWPAVPTEGFVVLPWGTRVYLEPRFGGASARLGWPNLAPPPWPTGGYVARVVGQRDGFVEIAPLSAAPQPHCGLVLEGEAFDVRLYVSPWALARVITREVQIDRDDSSALSLRPGAVVQPIPNDPHGRWAVLAAGLRVRAVLPDDAVGLAYAAPLPQVMPGQRGWQMPEGRPFSYEGSPIEVDLSFGHDVAIVAVDPLDDGYRVELWSPCGRVVAQSSQAPPVWQDAFPHHFDFGLGGPDVVVPAGLLAPVEPEPAAEVVVELPSEAFSERGPFLEGVALGEFGGEGLLGTLQVPQPERMFEEGTPIYLSTAGPAAGTLSQLRVFNEEGWAVGDRLCFHTSFGARFDPSLAVCLPAQELRMRNPAVDIHDFGPGLVRTGSLRTSGALAEPAVARALRRHRPDLRRCLGEMLQRGVQSSGELELALDVDGKGAVTHVQLRSSFIHPLTDCAIAAAERWAMPPTADGGPAKIVFSVHLEKR